MRLDRFFTMSGMITSLTYSTDVSVFLRPANMVASVCGRCSPYVSHRGVAWDDIAPGHRFFCDPASPVEGIVLENSKCCLQVMAEGGEGIEKFPRAIFSKLFDSVEVVGLPEWTISPWIYVYNANITTRREREGAEEEKRAEAIARIPEKMLVLKRDAIDAGLCEDGIKEWLKDHSIYEKALDIEGGLSFYALKALLGGRDDLVNQSVKQLIDWVVGNATNEFIAARMIPGEEVKPA